ncbi:EthD domain-containing protein [Kutzneria buriramensis]|uniref:EthD domain-containing protein n=1 Tax=Kutzneria buriramensis TaxID=1045776 RepID=A0A3E0H790_9PSEU|nr:EthD domain-containing protein [Kutzneria buriramensis]REH39303.1 EthD domain-containing protein [Kutzneria buriramensis]
MYKKLSLLRKRSGMTTAEFVDYYEHHHVPLILALAPTPDVYKRHYVERGDPLNIREDHVDFDVMTEIAFRDRAAFDRWLAALAAAGARVPDDEARFLDRSYLTSFAADEHVTADSTTR